LPQESHLAFSQNRRSYVPKFYIYFKENMDALNLAAPESLFGSL
jgi:hypothetical protein